MVKGFVQNFEAAGTQNFVRKPLPSTQIIPDASSLLYVIRNKSTKETYVGYTNNLTRRLREHSDKQPELIYAETYKSEKDAKNRERQLKKRGQAVRWLKHRIKHSLQE